MKTVRRLIYRQIITHVLMVAAGFSALAFFIDFVDEMQRVGKKGYTLLDAVWACTLLQGFHLYDLFPIALLIGSIMALARMAQTSEFTILRTGGLGPGRALTLLAVLGLAGAAMVAVLGDWVVPRTEQRLTLHRAKVGSQKGLDLGHGGAWLRERRDDAKTGAHNITVNVGQADGHGQLGLIRIFEFDGQGRLLRRISAQSGEIESIKDSQGIKGSIWHLKGVTDAVWHNEEMLSEEAVFKADQLVTETERPSLQWYSSLTPMVVAASVLPPETMSTMALWRYTEHLANNAQAAQRYEMQFWKKVFYPLVCFVMVGLALPFAYLHARSGGMSLKIFGGIMLGISFVLVNHISSHLGLLHHWQPWIAAVVPSIIYLSLSLGAFVWLVRYR
ncbi:LPS export ABC transporter permease LptG [Aquabacterium sp.]|uniref:LPS export ABC transporter permease LptG n=1 Tax=Aquabacterium sp. TaxID=1872578 RepID=UPI002E341D91|nr:LPS export ABC transporter permease LptG [Aquabacterium sp.]HEX5311717.1 LPS export ABC transporter permease LptG [Aquabacterium sp.]